MRLFTQDSLERLRSKIDLAEVVSPHVELKRAGSSFKGLCPFHDEKTPSFVIQKGDQHYHCFGCGEHGDAIKFLMTFLNLGFQESVESLAERFHVHLDRVDGKDQYTGPSKALMKEALSHASRFYHFFLLHSQEGRYALQYLYDRGITLEFIRQFQIGLAPKAPGLFRKVMIEKGIRDDVMMGCGLAALSGSGKTRDFFYDRITFPIYHPSGSVIGLSARKYQENTFGGKYVNTPETPLFKKSRVLFGLNHCRRRIVKERRVIIVEGQIDALRLIFEGFNFSVAAQGTAFGVEHAEEITSMGVSVVYLALDSDEAGKEAASKVGDLFQKRGVEVRVVLLPGGCDPDSFLMEKGPDAFQKLLDNSQYYLEFLVAHLSRGVNVDTPAGKNQVAKQLAAQIRRWDDPVLVHESLRRLSTFLQVPAEYLGVGQEYLPNTLIRKTASAGFEEIDPVKILELDFLRWLMIIGKPEFVELARLNVDLEDLHHESCRSLYQTYLTHFENNLPCDLLSLIQKQEDQELVAELMSKKVEKEKGVEHFTLTIQRILDRNWMEKREDIRRQLHSGQLNDDQAMALMKKFNEINKNKPQVKNATSSVL